MASYEVVKAVGGRWMVLVDGVQWGKGPRDASGASSETWKTKREATAAIEADDDNLSLIADAQDALMHGMQVAISSITEEAVKTRAVKEFRRVETLFGYVPDSWSPYT